MLNFRPFANVKNVHISSNMVNNFNPRWHRHIPIRMVTSFHSSCQLGSRLTLSTSILHRYLMSRLSLQVFYLWRHVLYTAPPFILWWSNLEILFAPLHRSSPFIGGLHCQAIQTEHGPYIAERTCSIWKKLSQKKINFDFTHFVIFFIHVLAARFKANKGVLSVRRRSVPGICVPWTIRPWTMRWSLKIGMLCHRVASSEGWIFQGTHRYN
jgi:hypothetical protein